MIDAIQWATGENDRAASKSYKRLNSGKIAVMGQSCGGVQAIEVAADRRGSTAVIWNSGLFGKPTNLGGGKTLSKQDLQSIHVPVAYIGGDPRDIAFKNAEADFDYLTKSQRSEPMKREWGTEAPIGSRMAENLAASRWPG
jgi:dienelactone hydrolase